MSRPALRYGRSSSRAAAGDGAVGEGLLGCALMRNTSPLLTPLRGERRQADWFSQGERRIARHYTRFRACGQPYLVYMATLQLSTSTVFAANRPRGRASRWCIMSARQRLRYSLRTARYGLVGPVRDAASARGPCDRFSRHDGSLRTSRRFEAAQFVNDRPSGFSRIVENRDLRLVGKGGV